ncbi:MAG: DNA polymerase III subunit [Kiritimatiellae bacterium]|nr:DNA polymerase III subunit [Kiritimatiellia bacterium]
MSAGSSLDRFSELFENLRQGHAAGRLAHAYLVVGAPRGNALALSEALLQLLFCTGESKPCGECAECRRVREHAHPDILWIEPESKGRQIKIDRIREELIPRLSQSAYGGGWKAGVLIQADRMKDAAANAFLKMLEEPPPSSLILLLTDAPQELLPTIVSRCHRLLLAEEPAARTEAWLGPLLEILRGDAPADALQALAQVARMKALLEGVRAAAEDEAPPQSPGEAEPDKDVEEARIRTRVLEARAGIVRRLLEWRRDVLLTVLGIGAEELRFPDEAAALRRQAAGLDYAAALRRFRAAEALHRQLERNVPDELAFEHLWLTG